MNTPLHPRPADSQDSWAVLAALRFFLSVVVFLGHFHLLVRPDPNHIWGDGYLNPGSAVFGFFILSGYSIAASLSRETSGYYRRRFVRIWPLYLSTIAFGLLVSCLVFHNQTISLPGMPAFPVSLKPSEIRIAASLLMMQTIVAPPIQIVGVTWSLATEWWLYMVAPRLQKLPSTALLLLAGISFAAFMKVNPPDVSRLQNGLGVLVASWLWITGFVYYRIKNTPVGFCIMTFPSVFALFMGHFTGLPLFITMLGLVLCADMKFPAIVRRWFNFLGDLSFPLYLFHIPVMVVVVHFVTPSRMVVAGAVLVVSALALWLIDYPCRAAARRWQGRRRSSMAGSAVTTGQV